jgi:hypothetical protein
MAEISAVIGELDAKHVAARFAFERKDIVAYTAIFSPTLRYHQPDGRTIGRDHWIKTEIGWQIDEVFVVEENVTSLGFQFGLTPKPTG